MNAPSPNDRLRSMLSGAKAVMNKVNENDSQKRGVSRNEPLPPPNYNDVPSYPTQPQHQPQYTQPNQHMQPQQVALLSEAEMMQMRGVQYQAPAPVPTAGGYRNIANSKMDPRILEAMAKNPIPQVSLSHSFNASDVADLMVNHQPNLPQRNIQETYQQTYQQPQGLSEQQIRSIIKDEMVNFVTNYFTKNLSEQIKKTMIKDMIAEGTIRVKKKTPTQK